VRVARSGHDLAPLIINEQTIHRCVLPIEQLLSTTFGRERLVVGCLIASKAHDRERDTVVALLPRGVLPPASMKAARGKELRCRRRRREQRQNQEYCATQEAHRET